MKFFDFIFHFADINLLNDKAAALREVIHVVKPINKFVFGNESNELAMKDEMLPLVGHL